MTEDINKLLQEQKEALIEKACQWLGAIEAYDGYDQPVYKEMDPSTIRQFRKFMNKQ